MFIRATLRAFDAATYTATVEIVGSRGFDLSGVPVCRGIPAVEMVAGRTAFALVADPTNPSDALIVGIH
jgi:hypothetical protein